MISLPPLFHRGKKGELRRWTVGYEGSRVIVDFGVDGGAMSTHSYEATPKNVGRANATTAEQQAGREAQALWEAKVTRKYSVRKEDAVEDTHDTLPMLAKKYDAKRAKFPALVQRKYDGNRMMARRTGGEWMFTSRQGREFSLPHIAEALDAFNIEGDVVLDGEIYCHGKTLQEIVSLVKRYRDESRSLQYVVYDFIALDDERRHTNFQRQALLQAAIPESDVLVEEHGVYTMSQNPVVHAKTYMVDCYENALKLQALFLEQGYEGAILRNLDGMYVFAYRSNDLFKLKVWEDAEFEIVDVIDKKLPGLAIFVCRSGDKTFEVVKKGSHAERASDFSIREALIGQGLTVRYAYMTKDGVPFHPVGIVVRPEWDR